MFTGIIEEVGTITAVRWGAYSAMVIIAGKLIFNDLHIGDSVAVNGVCLTATGIGQLTFTAEVMHKTLNRSSLGSLKKEAMSIWNAPCLPACLPACGRFGGHIVSGHIDGTGEIAEIRKDDNAIWYTISTNKNLLHYIIEKGSIAMDGISLTVSAVGSGRFSVSVIPHTAACTTLSERKVGDAVNLENDMVGKYIEKFVKPQETPKINSQITPEFLAKFGY